MQLLMLDVPGGSMQNRGTPALIPRIHKYVCELGKRESRVSTLIWGKNIFGGNYITMPIKITFLTFPDAMEVLGTLSLL